MDRLLRMICDRAVSSGRIAVIPASGRRFVAGGGSGEPTVTVRFADAAAERALIFHPELRFGELYMDGRILIEEGDLYDLLEMIIGGGGGGRGPFGSRIARRARHWALRLFSRNGAERSRSNVAHHYDLDDRFYSLFLDEDRNYSCAYFEHPGQSLEEAQLAKKRHVAAKLVLEPGQKVLDIGCGWGGLAIYLADIAGAAEVKGVTLSREQREAAGARVRRLGLSERVDIALQDYRSVEGVFDRIVSVGMFEHVGLAHYGEFFRTCARLMPEDGVMLLHTIGWQGAPSPVNPWIARYIFPGGHIPTLDELTPHIYEAGLQVADVEILRLHYAQTLRLWRERFVARWDEVARLYDERFCRMWEFYLASSEAGFRHDGLVVFQIQLSRRNDAVPITRDYIARREDSLRRAEAGEAGERSAAAVAARR